MHAPEVRVSQLYYRQTPRFRRGEPSGSRLAFTRQRLSARVQTAAGPSSQVPTRSSMSRVPSASFRDSAALAGSSLLVRSRSPSLSNSSEEMQSWRAGRGRDPASGLRGSGAWRLAPSRRRARAGRSLARPAPWRPAAPGAEVRGPRRFGLRRQRPLGRGDGCRCRRRRGNRWRGGPRRRARSGRRGRRWTSSFSGS